MEKTIEQIYQELDTIVIKNRELNDSAMKICQYEGYNGYKRFHRKNQNFFNCKHIELENNMFDKYRKLLNNKPEIEEYRVTNFKEHLYNWKMELDKYIKEIGKLNKEHFNLIGFENNIIKCIMELFIHDYEKACRWYNDFEACSWNRIEIMRVDSYLHEKYKKLEE